MRLADYVSPEELRRLLSTLVVFLVAVVIFLLFGFIVVPGIRNANRPASSPPLEPVALETGWLDPTDFPAQKAREIPPLDPKAVLEPTAELLARGKELYQKRCQQCHGTDGQGKGPSAAGLNPAPRNFTVSSGWKNGFGRPAIYKTLSEGIAGGSMAAYDYLNPRDRMALVHSVQSLIPFKRDPEKPAAVEALAKQLARPGGRIPGRIPLSMAMDKLREESPPVAALEWPPATTVDPSLEILRLAVVDSHRAALTLARTETWKEGPSQLARVAASGAPANGFATRVVTFTADDWQRLQRKLMSSRR